MPGHLFSKYVLSTQYIPDILLGTGDRAGNKIDAISGFMEYIVSLVKESNNEYTYIKIYYHSCGKY